LQFILNYILPFNGTIIIVTQLSQQK